MHKSKNTGYLHDLLPIIAAILILLPVLACTVHRARVASEQQRCTENLKRLGVACDMYQADLGRCPRPLWHAVRLDGPHVARVVGRIYPQDTRWKDERGQSIP